MAAEMMNFAASAPAGFGQRRGDISRRITLRSRLMVLRIIAEAFISFLG